MVLHLRNSRVEFLFDTVIHAAALLALKYIDAPIIILAATALLVTFSLIYLIRNRIGECDARIEEVSIGNSTWELLIAGCRVETLPPDIRFFSEFFMVLVFRDMQGCNYRLLLFPDSLQREELLRFRKYLRFEYSAF